MGARLQGILTGTRVGTHRWQELARRGTRTQILWTTVGRGVFQNFFSGLVPSGGSYARARSLNVAEGVGWQVWFVAADHIGY
jgi:hypothetical protein